MTVAGRATPFAVYRDAGDIDLSDDGRDVALVTAVRITTATPAANGHTDHYRRDLVGGAVGPRVLVTADANGSATAGPVGSIAPAEYGRLIALTGDRVVVSTSQALVSADTNRLCDAYEKELISGTAGSPLG